MEKGPRVTGTLGWANAHRRRAGLQLRKQLLNSSLAFFRCLHLRPEVESHKAL